MPGQFANGDYSFNGSLNITKNLTVNSNTLYVDSVNNRIGIGTSSPDYLLQTDITSTGKDVNLSGVIYINGTSKQVGIGTSTNIPAALNIKQPDTVTNSINFIDGSNNNFTGGIRVRRILNVVGGSTTYTLNDRGDGGVYFVLGYNTYVGKSFTDIVTHAVQAGGGFTYVSTNSANVGSPGARTYSYNSGVLQIYIAGTDNYNVSVIGFTTDYT